MEKIKNIDKAAERIIKAVESGEQIVIFGDSDLDGVSSMVITKETIDNLISTLLQEKKNTFPAILAFSPVRKEEGYGLNDKALDFIKSKTSGGLIVTMDCGITNFKEVDLAEASGFSVVIVDHHKQIGGLPKAEIIVDPKQEGDDYPFKEYCNAGLAFKLAEEILKDKMSSMLRDSFLELVALATISDMMPEVGENEEWIRAGLEKIETSQRPALMAMFSLLNPMDFYSKRDMVSKINSALNSPSISGHIPKPYSFLIESDLDRAKAIAQELFEESKQKQAGIADLTDTIEQMVAEKETSNIIFEGSPDWEPEYLGSTASRLTNYFNKPVFIYTRGKDSSRGTVRLPKGLDAVKAMESCKDLLVMFGGHAPAAGFTVKNENLEQFKKCLEKYFAGIGK
jgi:single-stranded-DNA-specific exonuclease